MVTIARHWFEVREVSEGLTMIREPHLAPLIRSNSWLMRGRDADLLIDSGLGISPLPLPSDRHRIIAIATHAHYDHVGGMYQLDEVMVHRAEAEALRTAADAGALVSDAFPKHELDMLARTGYQLADELLDAYPRDGFDPRAYALRPVEPNGIVDEGDVIDLGDRRFEVLHLPGHTPGSIGLWDAAAGILFSGDAVYDGPLIDELPESDIASYVETMRRLLELPVTVVHGGHDDSFTRERFRELCGAYLHRRAG